MRNKHVRAILDTCYGNHYLQYLQGIPDLDAKLRANGSSFICQTSSTTTEAYGGVFTPAFCALQSPDSRDALVKSFQNSTGTNTSHQHIQVPGLHSFGTDVLDQDDLMARDSISGLYLFRRPDFFHHAVMVVRGVRFDLEARTFHRFTLQAMEQDLQNLQVISGLAKMDSNGKLGIFAVRVPSLHEVVSAHVHYDASNVPEAINIRETKRILWSGPSPHIKYYIAEDAPYVPTQDGPKQGLDIKHPLAQTILSQADIFGQSISCWWSSRWTGAHYWQECSGEVFVARSEPRTETARNILEDDSDAQLEVGAYLHHAHLGLQLQAQEDQCLATTVMVSHHHCVHWLD